MVWVRVVGDAGAQLHDGQLRSTAVAIDGGGSPDAARIKAEQVVIGRDLFEAGRDGHAEHEVDPSGTGPAGVATVPSGSPLVDGMCTMFSSIDSSIDGFSQSYGA